MSFRGCSTASGSETGCNERFSELPTGPRARRCRLPLWLNPAAPSRPMRKIELGDRCRTLSGDLDLPKAPIEGLHGGWVHSRPTGADVPCRRVVQEREPYAVPLGAGTTSATVIRCEPLEGSAALALAA